MPILEHWPAVERTGRMLQPPPRLQLDPPLHHQHLPGIHDRVLAFVHARYGFPFHDFRALIIYPELIERGTGRALIRLSKQFVSFSPVFEVFATQIYTHSILNNLTFGGARYIATGRGFATSRISFSILFSRFAGPSIYLGMRTLLMLLYVTLSFWTPYLIYFWISILALCIAPFLFNPHQFSFADFIVDYR
jgi:hypothetical protein